MFVQPRTKFEERVDFFRAQLQSQLVLTGILIFTIAARSLWSRWADRDLFARLAVGKLILSQGSVPHTDPFSFSPVKPIWVDHEWLSATIFAFVNAHSGEWGLFLLNFLCASLSTILLVACVSRNGKVSAASVFFLWIAALGSSGMIWGSIVRSQIFTYTFIPALLFCLTRYERNRSWLCLAPLPICVAVWANLHGGVAAGISFVALFTLGMLFEFGVRAALAPAFALLLSIAATALNPYGFWEYWKYMLEALTMNRSSIDEWARVDFSSGTAILPLTVIALLVSAAFVLRRRLLYPYLFLILVTAYQGVSHQRFAPLFLIVAAVLSKSLYDQASDFLLNKKPAALLVLARAVCICIYAAGIFGAYLTLSAATQSKGFTLDRSEYPEGACQWLLNEGRGGRVLVGFDEGSYLMWRLYPKYLVSLDGRFEEVYPPATLKLVSLAQQMDAGALRELRPDYALLPAFMIQNAIAAGKITPDKARYVDAGFGVIEF